MMKMEERKSCVQEEEKAGVCVKRGQREREGDCVRVLCQ